MFKSISTPTNTVFCPVEQIDWRSWGPVTAWLGVFDRSVRDPRGSCLTRQQHCPSGVRDNAGVCTVYLARRWLCDLSVLAEAWPHWARQAFRLPRYRRPQRLYQVCAQQRLGHEHFCDYTHWERISIRSFFCTSHELRENRKIKGQAVGVSFSCRIQGIERLKVGSRSQSIPRLLHVV
jgi:hypothetical protein